LDDAKGYRIGTYNGDAMDKYFKSLNWDVDTAPDDVNNLYKLALNRIDLWVDDEQVAYYLIEKNNQKIKIHSVYTIQTLDVYLACNPNTDAQTIVKLMLAAKKL
jgi:polar amino acid transport system substrate-binding protein